MMSLKSMSRAVAITVMLSGAVGVGHAQATKDPRITGTYLGIIEPHDFNLGTDTFDVAGVLFAYVLKYDPIGYHYGQGLGGVLFAEGRRYMVTIECAVPPFPNAKNRDMDLRVSTSISDFDELVTFNDIGINAGGSWWFQSPLFYGKAQALYFRDHEVTYQNVAGVSHLRVDPTTLGRYLFPGFNGTVVTGGEAARVSASEFGAVNATRVKVRR